MKPDDFRDARIALQATQSELAIRLGVSEATIRNWERGAHRIPKSAAQLVQGWSRRGKIPTR